MKNNPRNTAEHTLECFEEEHFIVSRMKCNTEKGLLAECLSSILQRAMTLKGRWEYYIPVTGNSSLFTVPRPLQQQSSLEPPCLCSSFGLFISKSFQFLWLLLGIQIYIVLSNPGMCVTSTNLLLNGKFLRSQCCGRQFYPTVEDCTWRICFSYFLLPPSEC